MCFLIGKKKSTGANFLLSDPCLLLHMLEIVPSEAVLVCEDLDTVGWMKVSEGIWVPCGPQRGHYTEETSAHLLGGMAEQLQEGPCLL